ncbi:hypothetical protein [Aquirhabdus parva]|uniref:DUF4288 domain-containing protein n=1 Tax=Aquirhabdus parva TaxID=2283318 RepID=A0A345P6R6_9GAMM|nr:hypothetical protein [Aquirhabdus parva]AXI02975.1 hypothetical protein HYN46_09060 [Aquirhabdus parva]
MDFEIHVFLAKGTAQFGNSFTEGERHALHIYVRQNKNAEYDGELAMEIAERNYWTSIELFQVGRLSINAVMEKSEPWCLYALEHGDAIVAYDKIET